MKQNLTRKPVISRVFSVTGITSKNRHNWPDFFYQGTSLRFCIHKLMVFKKAVLVLK